MADTHTRIQDLDLDALARRARLERARHLATTAKSTTDRIRRLAGRLSTASTPMGSPAPRY